MPGVSENIRVSSVVDRFLEHSRVFSFGDGGEEEVYISSADWMPRNFHRRVEVMFPILDEKAKEKIRQEVFEPLPRGQLAGPRPRQRRRLRPPPARGRRSAAVDAQQDLLDRLARRGLKAVPAL